ncbi:hypothetical protein BaRGS_00027343 [Batillaria attramentaria]|uniref:Uncharacterized protein n=1 Tax=Batillaria attramentaria TaxID=370345 RepID=A0ABD0K1W9_9CAEN
MNIAPIVVFCLLIVGACITASDTYAGYDEELRREEHYIKWQGKMNLAGTKSSEQTFNASDFELNLPLWRKYGKLLLTENLYCCSGS